MINIRTTERNGNVVALRAVTDRDELMMITFKGIMLRMGVSQMREIGRATQGVRLIRPDPGDRVVSVARIVNEERVGEDGGGDASSDRPAGSASGPDAESKAPAIEEPTDPAPEKSGQDDTSEETSD